MATRNIAVLSTIMSVVVNQFYRPIFKFLSTDLDFNYVKVIIDLDV